jgi:hypothetical protein
MATSTAGIQPIIPTGATSEGLTVSPNGIVTFIDATEVSVDGAFTSEYDKYQIDIDITQSASPTTLHLSLRADGADEDSESYSVIHLLRTTAPITDAIDATSWNIAPMVADTHTLSIVMVAPALPRPTSGWVDALHISNSSNPLAVGRTGIHHRTHTQADGFTLRSNSGTITGNARIYGFTNND